MDRTGSGAGGLAGADVAEGSGGALRSSLAAFTALGPSRIVALGAVAVLLLGFFAYVIGRAAEPDYTLLFSGLELTDAQQLTKRLDGLAVPYRLSPAGDAIMVPADEVLRLRMTLAQEGLPVGKTTGYELFDEASPFTTSDFLGNVNLRRAVEGELARTIGALRQVRSARVHIVEPKRSLFGREEVKPSASMVVSLRQPGSLDRGQVAGIRHLVAAAIPGLKADGVTIVDDAGELLAEPAGSDADAFGMDRTEEHRVAFENRLREKIVALLERTLGHGKVEAAVSADLDFDEVATTAELYDPNTQVVRSTQTTEERNDLDEKQAAEPVSVANNLPTERAAQEAGPGSSERKNRTEETVNYEISRTVRNQTKRGSTVRKLSIAVQVDGIWSEREGAPREFQPRSADELAQLEELVRSAAGVDQSRGDVVEVVSRPFLAAEVASLPESSWPSLDDAAIARLIELAVLIGLTLVVLFFGVRPLLSRLMPAAPASDANELGEPALTAERQAVLLTDDRAAVTGHLASAAAADGMGGARDVAPGHALEAQGRIASNLMEEVSQMIERQPEDAVRVLRAWLQG